LTLDSYCPNRTVYEVSRNGPPWEKAGPGGSVIWNLRPGWNMLRLRTRSKGEVLGPETGVVMFLEKRH
jgi:hypothetical protein